MSRPANLELQNKAFLMYSAEIKLADIAKELKITPNTLSTWKKNLNWDDKITKDGSILDRVTEKAIGLTTSGSNSPKDIDDHLKDAVIRAITIERIRPRKWKDVLDTLSFLGRGAPRGNKSDKSDPTDVTSVDDVELEKQIEELQGLIQVKEDDAIVLDEDSVIH